MALERIPSHIQQFLWRHIGSVGQLEMLCVLAQAAGRSWTVADLMKEIQSNEESISACLKRFAQIGLLSVDDQARYRFAPSSQELADTAAEVVKTYRERRVTVIETIYQRPSDSIQGFADAFRLKQEN